MSICASETFYWPCKEWIVSQNNVSETFDWPCKEWITKGLNFPRNEKLWVRIMLLCNACSKKIPWFNIFRNASYSNGWNYTSRIVKYTFEPLPGNILGTRDQKYWHWFALKSMIGKQSRTSLKSTNAVYKGFNLTAHISPLTRACQDTMVDNISEEKKVAIHVI